MDIGASTGGFTDCMLQHSAAHVLAVDVGHDQLAPELRADPRVTVMEGTDLRMLPADAEGLPADFASCDVSFISLRQIIPHLPRLLTENGTAVLLVKPQTFMNLSGESVAPVVKYHNATAADLLVVQDDIDLPVGRLRLRTGGSCGGHNGVRNIIERLGTTAFARLKLGVGKDRANVIGHVLGKFDPVSRKVMDLVVAEAVKAAAAVLRDGLERAMNAFNAFDAAAGGVVGASGPR